MAKKPISKITEADPPPPREQRYDWAAIAEQLKAKPDTWHLIFEGDLSSLVIAIRQDGIAALKKRDGFEVRTANNKKTVPPTCDLFLKYNPKKVVK